MRSLVHASIRAFRYLPYTAGALLALTIAPATAQPPADSGLRAPDIVVSASRAARRAGEVGSTVTTIDAAEIAARQYVNLADALRDAAGATLARNGSFGGFSSVRLRGGTTGQTLVVIDGIVVNDPAAPQGGYNFANLDIADIARIEVLRGPQGLLYGADAVGGVVYIETRRGDGRSVSGYFEGGSRATVRGGATLSLGDTADFLRVTASGLRTDGISRAAVGTEPDAYSSFAGSIAGGARLGPVWRVEATARASRSRADIDGFPPPLFLFGDTAETETTKDYAGAARLLHDHGETRGSLTLAYSRIDRRNEDSGVRTFGAKGDRLALDYAADAALADGLRLVAGANVARQSAEVSGVDDRRTSGAVFGLLEWRPFDWATLAAGARRDEFSDFAGATTGRASLAVSARDNLLLRASWGQGYRAPTLFELNFDQFGVVPNPNLKPERAHGFDAGIEWRPDDAVLLRTTVFETRTRDLIGFEFFRNGYFNIDRARARGVEVEAAIALSARFDIDLAYTFLDAEDRTTGDPLLRLPRHKGTLVATARPTDRLNLSASLILNGREADFPAPNESFARLDLRAAYRLGEAAELYARIENASDTDYQDVSGYGEPGASVFVGMRLTR